MQVLFSSEEIYQSEYAFVIIAVAVSIVALVIAFFYKEEDRIFARSMFYPAIGLLILAIVFSFISKDQPYANCYHEVLLNGDEVPKGYDLLEDRGEIARISMTVGKEVYHENVCSLEGVK